MSQDCFQDDADQDSIVIVDLHPAFSKPAGHRGMEIFEDPTTGKQQLSTYIKVPKYLNIPPSRSEAVRGQPEPLVSLDPRVKDVMLMKSSGYFIGHSRL